MRIYFNSWGMTGDSPKYAVRQSDSYKSDSEIVADAVARKNGWIHGRVRSEGATQTGGKIDSYHYSTAVGRPSSGGMNVVGQLWFAIRPWASNAAD